MVVTHFQLLFSFKIISVIKLTLIYSLVLTSKNNLDNFPKENMSQRYKKICWLPDMPKPTKKLVCPHGDSGNSLAMCTVMTLSFRTNWSGQIVQTQIRLLLEEQSDQGLHYLQYCLHLLDALLDG